MIPGTTLTPNQQHSLNMAYLRVKHEGHARLAKSLRELGGQDIHEGLLTINKTLEQHAKLLDEMNKNFKKSRSRCTIL